MGAGEGAGWGARLLGQPQGRLNVILGGLLLLVSVQRLDQKWFYEGELREAGEKLEREERRGAQLQRELEGVRAGVLAAVEGGGRWGTADRVKEALKTAAVSPFGAPGPHAAALGKDLRTHLSPAPELAGGAPRMI